MMAYFTHCYKSFRPRVILWLGAILYAFTGAAFAGGAIQINAAELRATDDAYSLVTKVDVRLDKDIIEAVNKGVPLNFIVEFQIVIPHEYWFDDEVVTTSQNITLSYHALTRQYLVNRNKNQESYESLGEALENLATFNDWKVVDKSLLEKDEQYRAALLIRLDQSKLPKAIQVDAIGNEKWNLTSEKFEWALKDLNNREPANKDSNSKEVKP